MDNILGLIAAGLGAASTVAGGGAAWVSLKLRAELAELRSSMEAERATDRLAAEERRSRDRDQLMTWINGSFMRSKVVEIMMSATDGRISSLEDLVHRMQAEQ